MIRKRTRLYQLLACAVMALMSVAWASGDEKADRQPGLSQWAIIATSDAETRGVADLLTAELSASLEEFVGEIWLR